ncbi:MAG: PD-(D/E)XK nuclease family protein, partial [Ignavibacteria bacterium]|nr:PD-(D/E)XK nuclease family protein [Ignavibacteria bacterium]
LNQDFSEDKITLAGELTFLQKENDKFLDVTKHIEIEIPIIHNVELSEKKIEATSNEISSKELILSEITDHSKGEVISATRFSTFSSCPAKYNLLYNYKISDLVQRSKDFRQVNMKTTSEEYNRNELDSHLFDDQNNLLEYSKLKGKIIHYALRKNLNKENISSFVEGRLKNTLGDWIPQKLKEDIIGDLLRFYKSDEYKFINSFPNFQNEFEIYLKERDYYLFGILDKLIIDEKKIIIIDYKTDNIKENELNSKAEKYLSQLQFYAYIVSRLLSKSQEIEGRIIFIKYPDKPFVFNYDDNSDSNIKSGINSMIESIRNSNYSVNLSICNDCIFADDKSQCIKINSE